MSKVREGKLREGQGKSGATGGKAPTGGSTSSAIQPAQPLRPHPKLFAALGVIVVAWIAFLLVLYFSTVRGRPRSVEGEKPEAQSVAR